MQIHYLEIVTKEVDAVCAAYAAVNRVQLGEPDAGRGGARTAALPGGGLVGVRARAGFRCARRNVVQYRVELGDDEIRVEHFERVDHLRVLHGQKCDDARSVHAMLVKCLEVGLDPGPSGRIGARDGHGNGSQGVCSSGAEKKSSSRSMA